MAGEAKQDSQEVDVGWIQPGGKRPEDVAVEPSRRVIGKRLMSAEKKLEVISGELKCIEDE